jgi:EAL domain-containing protein (putative c-di-GMP-specific phosphodiesterase class I)/GGDEF domain-containing protein
MMLLDQSPSTDADQEVEISYTEQQLTEKLTAQTLKQKQVLFSLKVNKKQLAEATSYEPINQLEPGSINSFLSQLEFSLENWLSSKDFTEFTSKINQLIFLWLNALQAGASTQTIVRYLSCFELKSTFGFNQSPNMRCFFYDLLAETAQKHQQLQLDYVLNFDVNTQLRHSNQLHLALEKTINKNDNNKLVSLLSIHFQIAKHSATFSHIIAMNISKKVAAILLQQIPSDTQLYYSGNLQFDLLIPNIKSNVQLDLLAAKLGRAFEEPIFIGSQSILVTPFTGCALFESSSQKVRDIVTCANLALESALTSKQQFLMYSDQLQTKLSEQIDLENRVLNAFANDNLTLFLQPIVDLKSNTCVGAELLLRWSESASPSVYPSLTVEILNKAGKGKLFTRWLVNSACRYSNELLHAHKLNVYLTLNLRAEDLYDVELPHMLMRGLALWDIQPKDIILEVTEDGILEMNDTTNTVINELAESGFRLALDDFGTGFSSLTRLRTMPIDLIKIDQSFVRNIEHSKDDLEIVKSIALLANSLGKEVLAEGVEDLACLDIIKGLNIHKGQGYYFAKPMPFEQFTIWAKQHGA